MILDEKSLSDALQAIDADVSPDLAARARAGGRRRLVRRRSLTAVGAVAVGAVAAPITLAVRHHTGSGRAFQVSASPTASDPGLYAAPPAAGSECNAGNAKHVQPTVDPDLLLLPPAEQPVRYAFVRSQIGNCLSPHVALAAFQMQGASVGAGLVVYGPNAPTPAEDGRVGPHIEFGGDEVHAPIDGQPATEFALPSLNHTDIYWTEPDGGQWRASVRDMSASDADALVNSLRIDGGRGTATLPSDASEDWSVEPNVPDASADDTGLVMSQWVDSQGHVVDLTVTQSPNRTVDREVGISGPESFVTVRGRDALYSSSGGNGGGAQSLTWQEAKDVTVDLAMTGGTTDEIKQVAESLSLASPDDPRLSSG
ncbi:MAG TPA: hypothetical protein VHC43_04750 [Mycobacteriales bacterium]|nr:hypothetical protein [Mycobacteriales bacterium]